MKQTNNDQPARDAIRTDLSANMLVEAGAGSGKTTSLVARMLEHVRTGTSVERLTAVTFTRKAANELRERFQIALEEAIQKSVQASGGESEETTRYRAALRTMDRAYLGTIHGFCARLLRERPLEIGIDPTFQETSGDDWDALEEGFWRKWVERAKQQDDIELRALYDVGIDPRDLHHAFSMVVRYPDVDFPLTDVKAPDVSMCRAELTHMLDLGVAQLPADEPEGGWDDLMKLVRRLRFSRDVEGWGNLVTFCTVLESITKSQCEPVLKRWSSTKEGKAQAKQLEEGFLAFLASAADVLRQWREHRYPIVMRFLQRAAKAFVEQRYALGALGFEDLLLLTARLLREHPAVRLEFGTRYAHLLVDEFQDTDPVQAEVCLLLASHPNDGTDWRKVKPRAGSLFVVGDPKQSIYRFRRADIQVYEQVKEIMSAHGKVLALTANFRSNDALRDVVNEYFTTVFPEKSTTHQAAYSPMQTMKTRSKGDGVTRYVVRYDGRGKDRMLEADASLVASWIADRVARKERAPGDFLILTPTKESIDRYARSLAEHNTPVSTTGAALPQEHELGELLVVLRAIADPENSVAVAAVLEGLFFGLSPADLWRASQAKLRFAITHPPSDKDDVVGRALMRLHEWWRTSQRHAADILLERIIDETGLLVHAASQPLGDARAGALMHLVESLRLTSVSGANGITDAMERLTTLLDAEAPDAPLRPGRTDAVRVMNLHKAKGLEAPVVILAAPQDAKEFEPEIHVTRGESDIATGAMRFTSKDGNTTRVLAHPPKWSEIAEAELEFGRAEEERLRYVAVTRAKDELVVSQGECQQAKGVKLDNSKWRPLAPVIDKLPELQLAEREVEPREEVQLTAAELASAVSTAESQVNAAAMPSIRVTTVTERVKESPGLDDGVREGGKGAAWGRAVHRTIEALGRGRRGAALKSFALAVARDERLDAALGDELVATIEKLERSGKLASMMDKGELMMELTVMRRVDVNGVAEVTEGVIDAAVKLPNGWSVVDWKTDDVSKSAWDNRKTKYEAQVASYAAMLAALSGAPATGALERIVSA